jgi:AcrR family transcriptional regulator
VIQTGGPRPGGGRGAPLRLAIMIQPDAATATGAARQPRQDVTRNKAALLAATGELLLEDHAGATMAAIAKRAGLSVATAYRYYPTLDQLHREYLLDVLERLVRYAEGVDLDGAARFEAVLGRWLELVTEYGPAMVLIRSREGFLARLAVRERHATIIDAAWGEAIRELMRLEHVAPELYDYALALCNAMFNSRELLDLARAARRSPSALVQDLTRVYRGTLRGLAETRYP